MTIFPFVLEISNKNGNDKLMNKIKDDLENFETISLENGDLCLISFFKDFKNIYVCKAIKDSSEDSYNIHNLEIILKTIENKG